MKTAQNLILFKLGWLSCILLAAYRQPLLALLAVAIVAAVHLARVAAPAKESVFLLCAAAIGLAWETFLHHTGQFMYVGEDGSGLFAPAWIVAMWILFATTINHGLSWLKRHWSLAALFGAVGGPLAFYGGSKMGAVEFADPVAALMLLAVGWAVLLPLTCLISDTITDSELFEAQETRTGNVIALQSATVSRPRAVRHG